MKQLTIIRSQTNTKMTIPVGSKFRHVEWDQYGSHVNMLVECDNTAPMHEVTLIAVYSGMALPDASFYIGVIPSPFMALYGVPDTE